MKACNKCGGQTIKEDTREDGPEEVCLQCGYRKPIVKEIRRKVTTMQTQEMKPNVERMLKEYNERTKHKKT